MHGLAPRQHLDELLDPPGPRLRLLGASDPIENGVPIRTGERLKHCLSTRIGAQGLRQVLWNVSAGLPGVGGTPATISHGLLHLLLARSVHAAGVAHPFGDGDVPLRPRSPGAAGSESSLERRVVTPFELPVDPAEADRLVERLVVGERCRVRHALLRQDQPHAL